MLVRLTVKLAEVVDGVDLSHCSEGDIIDLRERDAMLLIAERWAEAVDGTATPTCEAVGGGIDVRAVAADRRGLRRSDGNAA